MECEYDTNNSQDKKSLQNFNESKTMSLLDLNEYCLLKVFDYLYISDMINFGETCEKLQILLRMAVTKFKEFDFRSYKNYVEITTGQPLSIEKILFYVAPHIESLLIHERANSLWIQAQEDNQRNFESMKSLRLGSSGTLKWINVHNVELLDIDKLEGSDLSNFTSGMTKLKVLMILRIADDVPEGELRWLLERNSSIESLKFGNSYRSYLPIFQDDSLSKLRNLKRLEFYVGKNLPDLMLLLKIEDLTELSIEFNKTFDNIANGARNMEKINQFLDNLAQKRKLKSLELRSMHLNDNHLFYYLSSLNLVSLRLAAPRCSTNLCSKIANATFSSLTDLDIGCKTEVDDILNLIKHFKALERLWVVYLQKLNTPTFLERLGKFLGETTPTRPMLELRNVLDPNMVKVSSEIFQRNSMADFI